MGPPSPTRNDSRTRTFRRHWPHAHTQAGLTVTVTCPIHTMITPYCRAEFLPGYPRGSGRGPSATQSRFEALDSERLGAPLGRRLGAQALSPPESRVPNSIIIEFPWHCERVLWFVPGYSIQIPQGPQLETRTSTTTTSRFLNSRHDSTTLQRYYPGTIHRGTPVPGCASSWLAGSEAVLVTNRCSRSTTATENTPTPRRLGTILVLVLLSPNAAPLPSWNQHDRLNGGDACLACFGNRGTNFRGVLYWEPQSYKYDPASLPRPPTFVHTF
eukprot:44572-Rhodomonas_salina.2